MYVQFVFVHEIHRSSEYSLFLCAQEVDSHPLEEEEEEEEDINETELLAFTEKSPPSQSGHQSHSQDKTGA